MRAAILCLSASTVMVAAFVPIPSMHRPRVSMPTVDMVEIEEIPKPDARGNLVRTVILTLLSVQSAVGLSEPNEIGGLLTNMGDPDLQTNIFGTLIDAAFLSYSCDYLLKQSGILKESPTVVKVPFDNMEIGMTINIGREPGTWMPKEWAASGARLSVPLKMRFSDELVDLGFPGEETLNPDRGRYAKKLYCEGGSFVGVQGEVKVQAGAGAWSTQPSPIPGASTLNFFVDFPAEAKRNECARALTRRSASGSSAQPRLSRPRGSE